MVGAKIPVLEVEKLKITNDGRGIIVYDDGTNFWFSTSSPWTGISSNTVGSGKKFFPVASSAGWLRVKYISGSTYGATGATCYIPIYRNLNTNSI